MFFFVLGFELLLKNESNKKKTINTNEHERQPIQTNQTLLRCHILFVLFESFKRTKQNCLICLFANKFQTNLYFRLLSASKLRLYVLEDSNAEMQTNPYPVLNPNPKPGFLENFQTQNPYPNPSLIF